MRRFLLDKQYGAYVTAMGFSVEEILKKARLPEDLFAREAPSLTPEAYFRFLEALDALSPDEQTPIRLASSETMATFSPPIFAAYCSRNALTCLRRLAQYKPLIGALLYRVKETETEVSVELVSADADLALPEILVGIEFVFLTALLRKATRSPITPLRATARSALRNPAYAAFLGIDIPAGEKDRIVFSQADAQLPFLSVNESMWEFFAPELDRRLSLLETDDSCAARVRSALLELLPSGACAVEDVAAKLGYSKRSLQRKLQEEQTTFQKQLNHTRELLARHYVRRTDLRAEDIAYLLGYQDTGSFIRAFSVWTGESITQFRQHRKL